MDSGIETNDSVSEGDRALKPAVYKAVVDESLKKSRTTKDVPLPEVPKVIDNGNGKRFFRGRLLGKGGFARVYEVTDMSTNKVYALKAVPKAKLTKSADRFNKIESEIELHKSLRQRYVVGFYGNFEDEHHVYILLELCSRKSLVQTLKNRGKLTEPEVRYLMFQAVQACSYLHDQQVIHRDIKVGNFFLNADMELRLGDFGLAVRLKEGQSKIKTMCGTPNYIAPEVLSKEGHSYEVDTWALGCVMYTLLTGHPPFETKSLRETYNRIRNNEYTIPSRISDNAARLIKKMLQPNPNDRPSLNHVLEDDFFTKGFHPTRLPISSVMCSPKWSEYDKTGESDKKISKEAIKKITIALSRQMKLSSDDKEDSTEKDCRKEDNGDYLSKEVSTSGKDICLRSEIDQSNPTPRDTGQEGEWRSKYFPPDELLLKLSNCVDCLEERQQKLPFKSSGLFSKRPGATQPQDAPKPLLVTKWVDYSNKYGFGAQLSDGSVTVRFNDGSKIALSPGKSTVHYCDQLSKLYQFRSSAIPTNLQAKFMLLTYFANYMDKHLLKGGDSKGGISADHPSFPFVDIWFRTDITMVMYLSNGTIQVNFFDDHTKIVLIPGTKNVSVIYIDKQREGTSYLMSEIASQGCSTEMIERLRYCKLVMKKVWDLVEEEKDT
ncbi:serine/threonine-protein kinase PLK1-like [Montipora capricornis]|uniref:serine/threonine-protein kinase PLK1-like n=1 Tax=Montipora capricornis TaxID=246305 RepID=UPI0035F10D08